MVETIMTRSQTPAARLEDLPGELPTSRHLLDVDPSAVAAFWETDFPNLKSDDLDENAIWRDMLALTGTFRTFFSQTLVYEAWSELCQLRKPKNIHVNGDQARIVQINSEHSWIDIPFTFETTATDPLVECSGFLSVYMDGNGSWKVWMIRTILENLQGQPPVDVLEARANLATENTDTADNNGASDIDLSFNNTHFQCIVVGGGQAGLSVGGYLQSLGVSYVILDKYPDVGDSWDKRYDAVKLHTAREYAHLPFGRLYNANLPEFLTREQVANGHRTFVDTYSINIKCGMELVKSSWSKRDKIWTCEIKQSNHIHTLTACHVVFAVGAGSSKPKMPNYDNKDVFRGKILHSVDYKSSRDWIGLKGVVIGTANTAHDVADDMLESGLSSVTMVQRGSTWVLPAEHYLATTAHMYNHITPTEVGDRMNFCNPLAISRKVAMIKLHAMAAEDGERFDALEEAGFKLDRFGDIISVLYDKLGGHYVDVGTSAKISKGLIKIKSDAAPTSYTPGGLMFNDGTELQADVIVFATGFVANLRELVSGYIGKSVADNVDDFWGVDGEGELRAAFKFPGHPGVWFTGGTIGHARFFGRFIALQIKADVMGTPFTRYEKYLPNI